jgi:CRP-like cAMP-binding protein
MSKHRGQHTERNRLLLALSGAEYGRLLPGLELISVAEGRVFYEAREAIAHIYFPQRCVVSVVRDETRGRVELQTIGNEGVVGLAVFLGGGVAQARTVARVADHAVRMSAAAFRRAFGGSAPLRRILLRYTHSVLGELSRAVLCHRRHPLESRCAHCLLTTQDRVGDNGFLLTQASLAQMVGVRRPSLATAAAQLREAGLIRFARGRITITDRPGLESAACSCYGALRADHERPV